MIEIVNKVLTTRRIRNFKRISNYVEGARWFSNRKRKDYADGSVMKVSDDTVESEVDKR
jgi:hypothetical protein